MASLNKVLLIGNLTSDPEVRYLQDGKPVADIRIASNDKYKLKSGEQKESTVFVDLVAWGTLAETCGKYLQKGSEIFVEGKLQFEQWEKDGKKYSRIKVRADKIQFLSRTVKSENQSDAEPEPKAKPAPYVPNDEDLPDF